MNYLITGGTGFVGTYLRNELLKDGHYLTIITRSPDRYKSEEASNQKFVSWDSNLVKVMEETDVVINLAGENIFSLRWTETVKKRIYDSRILGTRKLVDAMRDAEKKPVLLISASGISYYGDRGNEILDESHEPGDDFLANVCVDWENEAKKAEELNVRVAIPRLGIVLENGGGFLEVMTLPFRLFVGGAVGSGKQFIPWIHMRDICRAILHPVEKEDFQGVYNACSPDPATMNEMAKTIGQVMRRPSFFRVPEFVIKTVMGEASDPALNSLNARPVKLLSSGFEYEFEDLEEALADVL